MLIGVSNFIGPETMFETTSKNKPYQYATAIGNTNAVVGESTAIGRWNNRVFYAPGKNASNGNVQFTLTYKLFLANITKIGVRSTAIGTYNLSQGYASVAIGYQNETTV